MNIETVNELIQSLESAGELSIKERKYLDLAKAYQQLAAENVGLIRSAECLLHEASEVYRAYNKTQLPDGDLVDGQSLQEVWDAINATPATDRIVAGIKADGRVEGAHFVANRMLAAWDAGFIEDTAKNAADIARMILTSTEFMADAPEGDFDRSFADGILEDIAQQMRVEAK
ncbi:ead/Ea22-like family protein [Klebsiella pneumoniae]|uniref:ead/Ea22-like family protein n=1 Tax=Klebsiella pneumoniae TaxID=573 RepID=UPI001CB6E766|nr:ead/Ea22-like family protein [Klebsiella pneumoniae]MDS6613561.1 ead/Ea22-like family protein [Klebsiella pneumoniae]